MPGDRDIGTIILMKRLAWFVLASEILGIALFSAFYNSLDFHIYWLGGHVVTDGARLYQEQLVDHWFTNTPFMAALFTPLTAIPLAVARVIWQLAAVAAFAWCCALTLKMLGRRIPLTIVVAAGLLLEPVWHSFFLGQVNLFLLALVLADMHRVAAGRPAGIGIGIATAVKLTPAVFIVLLLLTRRTRDAVTALAAFAVCTLLAYAIAPDASRVYWLHTFFKTSRVGVSYISNQSPYGTLTRILHGTAEIGSWYLIVPATIGVFGAAVAALWARRGDWLSATAVTGVTGLLVSPISWAHHWVWIVPVLAVLLRDGHRKTAYAGCLIFTLSPLWLTPHNGDPREYGFHLLTPVANCYLIAGLFFLVHMTIRLRRRDDLTTANDPAPRPAIRLLPAGERPEQNVPT
ncbi:glycosyltransferase 87 family protein [Actinomadura opuntiae]|uniref:glycosyltransferase 87 family protein n=1 Tax=Actinomadura sp. OS1-43 TaxID=604315 RepID=UPI00255A8A3D|nr:glycosyltransferase 87 family protein [Actinomadura sp. OS1-43]MDL4820048.1 glycosyltransferase 87 family protein [Actinomadura sp. OS1-43]